MYISHHFFQYVLKMVYCIISYSNQRWHLGYIPLRVLVKRM